MAKKKPKNVTIDTVRDYQIALEASRGYRDLGKLLASMGVNEEARLAHIKSGDWYQRFKELVDRKDKISAEGQMVSYPDWIWSDIAI